MLVSPSGYAGTVHLDSVCASASVCQPVVVSAGAANLADARQARAGSAAAARRRRAKACTARRGKARWVHGALLRRCRGSRAVIRWQRCSLIDLVDVAGSMRCCCWGRGARRIQQVELQKLARQASTLGACEAAAAGGIAAAAVGVRLARRLRQPRQLALQCLNLGGLQTYIFEN